jgi:hypothetical protein
VLHTLRSPRVDFQVGRVATECLLAAGPIAWTKGGGFSEVGSDAQLFAWPPPIYPRRIPEVRMDRRGTARRVPPLIYLCGPDGSGKSTAADMISEFLSEAGLNHRRLYSLNQVVRYGIITTGWIFNKIRHTERGRLSLREYKHSLSWHRRRPGMHPHIWRMRKRGFLAGAVVDMWFGWIRVQWLRRRGYVVLIETSPYDFFVKYHMPHFRILERILATLIPSPDITFVLTASADSIVSRKPELTVSEIQTYYARLGLLLQEVGPSSRAVSIRTEELSGLRLIRHELEFRLHLGGVR